MLRSFEARHAVVAVACTVLLAGCGGTIDSTEVNQGRFFREEATTMKDGGEPVTGTVVKKNGEGDVIEETEYKDGFPHGVHREWYDNGQMKREMTEFYTGQGRTRSEGTSRNWCENGQLKDESTSDENGVATGKVQSWTCSGKLLNMHTVPEGEFVNGSEDKDGNVVITQKGFRTKDGKFVGLHQTFSTDLRFLGRPLLEETWVDGALDGTYKTWSIVDGSPEQEGTYKAGKKIGTWKRWYNGHETVIDYDVGNFVNPQYAGAFMQAAGIVDRYSYNMPLQEYRTDPEKMRYYVKEGLVDPKKKIDLGNGMQQPDGFHSQYWTYAYVHAATSALPVLEELGADPKAVDSFNRSRLHYCVVSLARDWCNVDEMKRLIGLGVAVDQQDEQGLTPLTELMRNSFGYGGIGADVATPAATLLLDGGASPDTVANDGMTPLTLAVLYKQFDVATKMLDKSKAPNTVTKDGFNLIHIAFLAPGGGQFMLKRDDKTKTFIQAAVVKGVDPNLKAGENGTMKEIALSAGAIDVAQFLSSLTPPA